MGKFIGEWNSSLIVFSGFQTRIGYVDVKSSPVYFYFQRYCIVFNTITDTPNSFETERLNGGHERNVGKVHGAKGLNLFIFIYRICTVSSFIFIRRFIGVSMYHLNGNVIGWGSADDIGIASQFEKFSFQSTLSNPKQESALFGRY